MFNDKIIQYLEKCKGYESALFTTFNFDINFFEKRIFNCLYDNGVKKMELFVDSNELNKALQKSKETSINRKYVVNPIFLNASFHPKVILLLGKDKARLIVTSANITLSGYTLNNEIFNVFDYDKNNEACLSLIKDAVKFFMSLNDMAYYKDLGIFNSLEGFLYLKKQSNSNDLFLIHNLDSSVIKQLTALIPDKISSIDVAVPFYDKELSAYNEIVKAFECSNIHLYIQSETSTFPTEYNTKNKIIKDNMISLFSKLKSNNKSNFYHGKVFRFNSNNNSYILYGSSNFTLAALNKTYKSSGNIECNILEKGSIKDFDYFFYNFNIDSSKELNSRPLTIELPESTNFSFRFGIKQESVYLFFSYKKQIEKFEFLLSKNKLNYTYENNLIKVEIPDSILASLSTTFDVSIAYNKTIENFLCWYIDEEIVEYYRTLNKESSLSDITITDNFDKYKKYIITLIKALSLTNDEYSSKMEKLLGRSHNNKEDDYDEDEIDDFIVKHENSDELEEKDYQHKLAYAKSKLFSTRFFKGLKILDSYPIDTNDKTKNNNTDNNNSDKDKKPRKATPSEKRLERYIKNWIKHLLSENYINTVDYNHYKNNIGLLLDIINELKYKEKLIDVFDNEYIVDNVFCLIWKLLNMESNDDDVESTIILSLIIILENHIINLDFYEEYSYEVEKENQELLYMLNNKFNIRETFTNYLKSVIYSIKKHGYKINFSIEKYISEDLFGYKTKNELQQSLENAYGDIKKTLLNNNNLSIYVETNEISKYLSFKHERILKDIIAYCANNDILINSILILIKNVDYTSNFKDPIDIIEVKVNVANKSYVQTVTSKSGNSYHSDYKKFGI